MTTTQTKKKKETKKPKTKREKEIDAIVAKGGNVPRKPM